MRDKGFTILEYVVALTILALVLVTSITFFKSQSEYGRDTSKRLSADESVSMALLMMRQDILAAGLATGDNPALAVYWDDNAKRLYLSSGWNPLKDAQLSSELDTSLTPPKPKEPNIWKHKAYSESFSGNKFPASGTTNLNPSQMGGLIVESSGILSAVPLQNPGGCSKSSGKFTYSLATSASGNAAPAIVYSYDSSTNALMRNWDMDNNRPASLLGLDNPNLSIRGFYVTAHYWDQAASVMKSTSDDFSSISTALKLGRLRFIEVKLTYRVRVDKGGKPVDENGKPIEGLVMGRWTPEISKTIRVAPRTITLTEAIGQPVGTTVTVLP